MGPQSHTDLFFRVASALERIADALEGNSSRPLPLEAIAICLGAESAPDGTFKDTNSIASLLMELVDKRE